MEWELALEPLRSREVRLCRNGDVGWWCKSAEGRGECLIGAALVGELVGEVCGFMFEEEC